MPEIKTILVVEDEDAVLHLICSNLEALDCGIIVARSAEEARECLLETFVDMVLADYTRPVVEGEALFHWVREHPKYAKMLLMAIRSSQAPLRHKEVFDASVVRPFNPQGLTKFVRRILSLPNPPS
jgi:CheY-like chemotaxis protein